MPPVANRRHETLEIGWAVIETAYVQMIIEQLAVELIDRAGIAEF